jgi:alkaline phosphatase
MNILKKSIPAILIFISINVSAQDNYKTHTVEDLDFFKNENRHVVQHYTEPTSTSKPKNVILMIGDGMGTAQVYSGIVANGGDLYLRNFTCIGFSTTYSASDFVTDSGAGGTALSAGVKTYNGAIGVNTDSVAIPNIREKAEKKGLATGVVSTSTITHATPASFVAHEKDRNMYEEIAADFLKTNIDVFIGGGKKHFTQRKDSKDLTIDLKNKGYKVLSDINEISKVTEGKLAGFTSEEHNLSKLLGRGDELPIATKTAINILDNDPDGFFLMVEGSQIDWGGHQNNTGYIVTEVLDFDKAIGEALAFASKNKETLIIVTADHETGGFAVEDGNFTKGEVTGDFTTDNHSGVMVPVYAFGPGSENFRGFMNNIDIPKKIAELLNIE